MKQWAKRLSAAFLVLALLVTAVPLMSSIRTVQAAEPTGTMKNVKLSGGKLTWSKYTGADHYIIIVGGVTFASVSKDTTSCNVEDLAAKEGLASGKISVAISARNKSDNDISQPWTGSFQYTSKGTVAKPANLRWNRGYACWDAVKNADSYVVYTYYKGNFFDRYETKEPKISLASHLTAGNQYAFGVVAKRYHYTASKETKSGAEVVVPKRPSIASAAKGFKITWTKVPGAAGYEIQRRKGTGSYATIKTVTGGSTVTYTDTADTANTANTRYAYRVRSYNSKKLYSAYSPGRAYYKIARPAISAAKNSGRGRVTVSWKKNSSAAGYQIRYVTGTTSKTVSVSGASTVSKLLTGLKTNASYQFYVRTRSTVFGKTYYSAWSPAKTLKTTAYTKYTVSVDDFLNYRTAPGTKTGKVAGTLKDGAVVYAVSGYSTKADGYTWYKINIGSKFYYAASNYLKKA